MRHNGRRFVYVADQVDMLAVGRDSEEWFHLFGTCAVTSLKRAGLFEFETFLDIIYRVIPFLLSPRLHTRLSAAASPASDF